MGGECQLLPRVGGHAKLYHPIDPIEDNCPAALIGLARTRLKTVLEALQ